MSLEEIRTLVRTDLAAVDAMIRVRLKSTVPLVDQIAEHIIGGGGKRLRPLLCVLAGRACGIESDKHIEAAAFIIDHLNELSGVAADAPDRSARLQDFCRRLAAREAERLARQAMDAWMVMGGPFAAAHRA